MVGRMPSLDDDQVLAREMVGEPLGRDDRHEILRLMCPLPPLEAQSAGKRPDHDVPGGGLDWAVVHAGLRSGRRQGMILTRTNKEHDSPALRCRPWPGAIPAFVTSAADVVARHRRRVGDDGWQTVFMSASKAVSVR